MKTVIVGSSGGIGRELSKQIAISRPKMDFFLQGKTAAKLFSLKEEIAQNASFLGKITLSQIDFCEFLSDFSLLPKDFLSEVQSCDFLCVCYGPFLQKSLCDTCLNEISFVSSLNFVLPTFLITQTLPFMIKKKSGHILLFGGTSTDEIRGFKTNAVYAAQKTALCSIVKSVAKTYCDDGIFCNAVLPGFVETEYVTEAQKLYYKKLLNGKPMTTTKEIAKAACNLLFDTEKNGELVRFD